VSALTLNYILAMVIVALVVVIAALIQNWWDAKHGR
jgi:hypothetical protein